MRDLVAPSASDSPATIADWAELYALSRADRNVSFQDIAGEVRRGGSTDAIAEPDDPGIQDAADDVDQRFERTEALVDAVFAELDARARDCGGHYPYDVEEQVLQGSNAASRSTYVFLLLLSRFGKDAGPDDDGLKPEQLFEDVAAKAIASYLGKVEVFKLGAPRRVEAPGFRDAVNSLCDRLGEGLGVTDHPRAGQQKDARVDLVTWRSFPDQGIGKLVGYGQCSTSLDWQDHFRLQPDSFNRLWIRGPVHSRNAVFSFLPHRIPIDRWREATEEGGVVFDRCRLAYHAARLDSDLRSRCNRWSRAVLSGRVV